MKVKATPEARTYIRERGGLLFVWVVRGGALRGVLRFLRVSTEPPPDALEWQRVETKGFLVFLPPDVRRPASCMSRCAGGSGVGSRPSGTGARSSRSARYSWSIGWISVRGPYFGALMCPASSRRCTRPRCPR